MNMDRTTPLSTTPTNTNPKIENAVQTAHKVVDTVADKTTAQVDRLSSTAHRAVDKTAGAATQAAGWASSLPDQAKEVQARLTDSVCTSIRARPIATVAGALVVGYLLGRIARL
jgi:ABC-type transporter Mla subunit MlaD